MSNTRSTSFVLILSNNRLEKVPFVSVTHTSSNRLLLSNQDKGCTPSVAHSLPLPLGPALLNLWISFLCNRFSVTDSLSNFYHKITYPYSRSVSLENAFK